MDIESLESTIEQSNKVYYDSLVSMLVSIKNAMNYIENKPSVEVNDVITRSNNPKYLRFRVVREFILKGKRLSGLVNIDINSLTDDEVERVTGLINLGYLRRE